MNQILSDGLWEKISQLAQKSRIKRAAVAYVSNDDVIKFTEHDTLIVDASNAAIASGQTSAKVLERALKRKAALYSATGLHAKILLFDNTAVIGSSNISLNSKHSLIEAALVTTQADIVTNANNFINELGKQVFENKIDQSFINRIKKIKVKHSSFGGQSSVHIKLPKSRTWLISLWDYNKSEKEESERLRGKYEGELKAHFLNPNNQLSFYHFPENSKFGKEAKPGDSIIYIWNEISWDDYRWRGVRRKPEGVYRHVRIVPPPKGYKDSSWFFIEETFTSSKNKRYKWIDFLTTCEEAGVKRKVGQHSQRLLSEKEAFMINALWDRK